jgi:hypothetical protein
MSSINYTCRNCERSYKRKNYYEKHFILCNLNHVNKQEQNIRLQELDDTPCIRSLYEMILELAKKNEILNQKVDKLNNFINTKQKTISIVEWLNNNELYNNQINFTDMVIDFNVTEIHLQNIFNSNYIDGINNIFEELFNLNNINNLPIKAFDKNINTFYINNNNTWSKMTPEQFKKIINIISKKIMTIFMNYQKNNINKLNNEEFSIIYTKNVQKVLGNNLSNTDILKKLKSKLYKYLKVNLKNIVEYNFT